MSVRIYSLERGGLKNPVRGCCAIDYYHWTISISTIAEPHEILVTDNRTGEEFTDYASGIGLLLVLTRLEHLLTKEERENKK